MGEIRQLGVVSTEGPKPNEDIITALRLALKDAKSGKAQGVAIALAVYDPNSSENKQSTENIFLYSTGYGHALRVAVVNLTFRMDYFVGERSMIHDEPPLTDEDE
jgi:hypothetical protein